jgi:hypothetical protein
LLQKQLKRLQKLRHPTPLLKQRLKKMQTLQQYTIPR